MNKQIRTSFGPGLLNRQMILAGAALMAFAHTAHAQNSVTLYGITDVGFTFTANAAGAKQYALTSGNQTGSRWGVKGTEDLGGGLKAIFDLESGFSNVNGTMLAGTLFGYQAWVGLASQYGTVTMGRQYTDTTLIVGPFSSGNWAAPGKGYGTQVSDLDDLDGIGEVNNAVKYQSANYGGFTFGGLYSLGGTAGAFARNQVYDVDVAYKNGSFAAAAAYQYANRPNYSLFGSTQAASTTGSNMSNVAIAGYASASSQQIFVGGVSYTIGPVVLGTLYSNVRFNNLGSTSVAGLNAKEAAYRGSAVFNINDVSLKYYVTPSLMLGAGYTYTHDSGASGHAGAHYNQASLGALYSLSVSTTLYLVGVHQIASGTNSTGSPAVGAITSTTASSTNSQTVVTLGLRHLF